MMGALPLSGKRVHVAGSIGPRTPSDIAAYGHEVVRRVVRGVIEAGGGIVTGAGKEPRLESGAARSLTGRSWSSSRNLSGMERARSPAGNVVRSSSSSPKREKVRFPKPERDFGPNCWEVERSKSGESCLEHVLRR